MTRTSGLDFGSDPAHQWDTKRELFHLAEVCALPSAILLCAVLPGCHSTSDFFGGRETTVILRFSVCLYVCNGQPWRPEESTDFDEDPDPDPTTGIY